MSRDPLRDELARLDEADLRRTIDPAEGPVDARGTIDGDELIRLASNAYLALDGHPRVVDAGCEAAQAHGTGAGASPLVSGHSRPLDELEAAIAELKRTEDAVVFPSGYHANTGTIPALAGDGDLVLSDRLNHASIVDGCRLSNARIEVYDHADPEHLGHLLDAHRDMHDRCLVVTDGVFSMDGEIAPLPAIADVAHEHDAMLMVDDAHATGVLGEAGAGTAEHHGLGPGAVDVQMGTLSKALATQGGFVAGTRELCELLRNGARSYVFSTALAPPAAAAARAAIEVVHDEPDRRRRLHDNADHLRQGLEALGYKTLGAGTPIVPVLVGAREPALTIEASLREQGVFCPAIRPPSVPEGKSRLRATVTAAHDEDAIDEALAAFEQAAHRVGVPA